MSVSTIDIILVDGKVDSIGIDATESEAVLSVIALVEEVAKQAKVHPSFLLAHCGQVLCPDNCILITDKE